MHGRGEDLWLRPGRVFAAAGRHTFAQLAGAIDDASARWDRAHLHDFTLADGTRLTTPYLDWEDSGPALDDRKTTLNRLRPGEQFVYVFDFGDRPLPYWGWGDITDQYGRRWDGDDGALPPRIDSHVRAIGEGSLLRDEKQLHQCYIVAQAWQRRDRGTRYADEVVLGTLLAGARRQVERA